MPENPLLLVSFKVPFDAIRAEHVEPAVRELVTLSQQRIEQIVADESPRCFANTMLALEKATEDLDFALAIVRHLESVATSPELRAAWNAVEPLATEFYSRIPLHEELWKKIQAFAATDEARALTATRLRFLEKTLDSFRRHGAELAPEGKIRLAEIDVELTGLTTKFSRNLLDSTIAWDLVVEEESQLAGLPPSALAAARQNAQQKGVEGWRFTLQAPSYTAVMTYLDDAGIREKMHRAFATRATEDEHDNRPVIVRIIELRREKALLLGFTDFADFVLHDRMAHTGANAMQFLSDLTRKTQSAYERENAQLEAFAGRQLQPWDIAWWADRQRLALYAFDEEQLRPYFPAQRVVAGLFDITRRLFGVQVTRREDVPLWHEDVRYYDVHDSAGLHIGSFYADWFPRETKRDGAWMEAFLMGVDAPGSFEPHLGCICGNLTPPVDGEPALLTHREVQTIFHEFGHLLHQLLSRVEIKSLAGTSVAWDFVELPSQIMENWCWEREALDLFASHYQTGEAIPVELFSRMVRARAYRGANAQMRQLGFSAMDLKVHREYDPARHGDIIAWSRAVLQPFTPAPLPREHAMLAGFGHLFSSPVGYGAGYYSYKWAEVLDADAFTRFQQEGIFSEKVGADFRDNILSKGNSRAPEELYRNFMGRDPDPTALLVRTGLAA